MRMQFLYNKTNLKMSKKFFLALLAPLFVGGLVACNKQASNDLNPEGQSTGDTYMSVTFSTANPNSTRAAVKEDESFNSIGEYIGRDEIKNVNVYVISLPEETVDVKKFTSVTMDPDSDTNTNDFRTDAWKTTAGKKLIYVYVNIAGTDIEKTLDKATSKKTFEDANEKPYTLTDVSGVKADYAKYDESSKKDIISMNTVTPAELEVKPGVKKADAEKNDATEYQNRAKLSVRRLVGQAAVTSTATEYPISETYAGSTTNLAKLSGLKWDVMQYELTTYLMPLPTEDGKDAKKAEFCKTPWWNLKVDDASYKANSIGQKYFYSAFNGKEVKQFTRDTDDTKNIKAIVETPMKFITETTHQHGGKIELTDPKTGYRKGNTTYVIVSAKITPDDNAWATNEEKTGYTEGSDLYFGVQDHKFYKSLDNAKKANKTTTATLEGEKDNVIKYAKGICYYVAWLNPDNAKEPVVSPVLRNNIYHVNISAIKKLGYSGNPFNPKGDNPKDPDDPTPDPKETLYPVDTYMSVEINVVNWGVHSYDNEF